MRAMRYHQFGNPDLIREDAVEEPRPAADELLIDVHASSANPADWQLGAGLAQGLLDITLPFTPGIDFSGTVAAVGPAVDGFRVGQHVYGAELLQRSGAFAERIAVPARRVAPAPTAISLAEAAAVPLAALTAWEATYGPEQANLQPGQHVLIHGGAGGTGLFAVQFAHLRGAHVTVTASPANHAHLKRLGAHDTIDYHQHRFEDRVANADVVIDLVGGDVTNRSLNVLRDGGILTSIVAVPPDVLAARRALAARRGIRATVTSLLELRDMAVLRHITRLIDDGELNIVVSGSVDLSQVAHVLTESMTGHARGKTIVTVADGTAR